MEKEFLEAVEAGDTERVKALIGSISHPPTLGEGLIKGSEYGYEDVVECVLASPHITPDVINATNEEGRGAIHYAADYGYTLSLSSLLSFSPDLSLSDRKGKSVLHCAVGEGENYGSIAATLIRHGANKDAQDHKGNTPLHYIAKEGLIDLATTFLLLGANVNLQNLSGQSPAHIAAANKQHEMLRHLQEYEADLTLKDNLGNTPIDIRTKGI